MRLSDLENAGFDILTENHARAILTNDFPVPLGELCKSLNDLWIADVELVRGGGGEAHSTQRLRHSLTDSGWPKSNIIISKIVDGKERAAITHEIDHVRKTENGAVALEIEWNNKDPFFDRDLENFQRLHSEGAISVGVIVTRGKSLQEILYQIVKKCAVNHGVRSFEDLGKFDLRPTERQRGMVTSSGEDFVPNWARMFVRDKFGTATTHWDKLLERIRRGVGNPCPLLLIGIPAALVFEDKL
ncbi:MAG: BglII/BstYI family type II restriction endonuclease [Halieaceae bacterium]|nr:BglII/BstYI family type II restriction endonuclease [Halieaceae bacterium]